MWLWLLAPLHAAATLFLLLRARSNGLWAPTLAGVRDGLAGIGPVWRARRAAQRLRKVPVGAVLAAMTWSVGAMRRRAPVVR